MFTLKIESSLGLVELTHDLSNYAVVNIQGLTPPPTTINTAIAGSIDGSFFNSARVESRNIVITIILAGDIEGNRQRLYRIFPNKIPVTVYFKNKNRDVKISGYVETIEGEIFSKQEQMQISIICPRPYFESVNSVSHTIGEIQPLFEFPFSIAEDNPVEISEISTNPIYTYDNTGEVATGAVFTFTFGGSVTGVTLTNYTTMEYIGFNASFSAGDVLTVSTIQGQLYAKLLHNGTETNMLNYLISGSTWVKLAVGENELIYTVTTGDDEDVVVSFIAPTLYGGV